MILTANCWHALLISLIIWTSILVFILIDMYHRLLHIYCCIWVSWEQENLILECLNCLFFRFFLFFFVKGSRYKGCTGSHYFLMMIEMSWGIHLMNIGWSIVIKFCVLVGTFFLASFSWLWLKCAEKFLAWARFSYMTWYQNLFWDPFLVEQNFHHSHIHFPAFFRYHFYLFFYSLAAWHCRIS